MTVEVTDPHQRLEASTVDGDSCRKAGSHRRIGLGGGRVILAWLRFINIRLQDQTSVLLSLTKSTI